MKIHELILNENFEQVLKEITSMVAETIGEASMLWTETPTGEFESTKAVELVNNTIDKLDAKLITILDLIKNVTNKNSALEIIQQEHKLWCDKNFGETPSSRFLMGAVEEAGELSEFTDHIQALTYFLGKLAHGQLKHEQKIRVNENHLENIKDAVSDIIIFLIGFCNTHNININEELIKTWTKVRARDWTQNKVNGDCKLPLNEQIETDKEIGHILEREMFATIDVDETLSSEQVIAKYYNNLPAIVEQLTKCNYETEGGVLVNNVAFIALQRMARTNQMNFDIPQS